MKRLIFTITLMVFFGVQIYSQGKIISKESADKLFGPVLISVKVPTENLKSLITQSSKVVMFKIINNNVYVLDDKRNVLSPSGLSVSSSDVFSVYAVSVVQELLNDGGSSVTFVEQREKVLTITNGEDTLEYSFVCPPYCP